MSEDSVSSGFDVQRVFDEAMALFRTKNADYGDAWRERGWMGNLSRIGEKAQRLQTTLWHDRPVGFTVADETARETVIDIINACAFFIVNWDQGRRWGTEATLPSRREVPEHPVLSREELMARQPPLPDGVVTGPASMVTVPADQVRAALAEQVPDWAASAEPVAPRRKPRPHPTPERTDEAPI